MVGCFSIAALYGSYLRCSLSAAGLTSHTIEIDDQTTLHFWGPKPKPNSNPQKPALVLIQGFGPDAIWQWTQQAVLFSAKFDVYMPDLVFFGGSTTKSADRSVNFQAASVGKLLEKVGVEKYSVMGTSYGGFVAYLMAAMWPERVEKVVIASSAINKRDVDDEELMKRGKVDRLEDLLLPTTAKGLRRVDELAVYRPARFVPDFVLNDMVAHWGLNRTEKIELLKKLDLVHDNIIGLHPLEQEVLIVWGEHDQLFPLKKATEVKEILGAKARLEVIKKTAHLPQIESPHLFNTIVYNFIHGSP